VKKYIVVTTVNPKTEAISKYEEMDDWHTVVVGDEKTPWIESSDNLTYLPIEDQIKLGYKFVNVCPYNDYIRKNIGYLYAMRQGADVIYDTDDDNIPYDDWRYYYFISFRKAISYTNFVNIYRYFSDKLVWPRGYPLDEIHKESFIGPHEIRPVDVGVWQGMADMDPDVDAIYRLTVNRGVVFKNELPIVLGEGFYCPFNAQNTFWDKKAFPYMYLPFKGRFSDILRSYIAQRSFWEHDLYLGFTKATVYHERNEHDLMVDFKDEIEMHLSTKKVVDLLDRLDLTSDPIENLQIVYYNLTIHGFVEPNEQMRLKAWTDEIRKIYN
jgi:hypothetical protein